jgi:hypothetical protein
LSERVEISDDRPRRFASSDARIRLTGVRGTVTEHGRRLAGDMRAVTDERPELDAGLSEAGLEDALSYELDLTALPQVGGRGDGDEAACALEVPTGEWGVQFALYQDPQGVVTIHYPQSAGASGPDRGAGPTDRYLIPLRVPAAGRTGGGDRGIIGKLIRGVIKIVVGKVLAAPVGRFIAGRASHWEDQHRKFRGFHGGSTDALLGVPQQFTDWDRVRGRRTLLFIHGTFSDSQGGFRGLGDFADVRQQLMQRYDGRVLGFDHHTLGPNVSCNVRDFFTALPEGDFEFDIVCHSRGGLVARGLSELDDATLRAQLDEPGWTRPGGRRLTVRRVVFVGTPNEGTALARPDNLPRFIDWGVTKLNLLPDEPVSLTLGGLLALAATVAEAALPRVPGLADQDPGSPLLEAINQGGGALPEYFGIQADYEPDGLLQAAADALMDRAFRDAPNDLVVPTETVSRTRRFALDAAHVKAFGHGDHVHHTNFFKQRATWEKVLEFLGT